MTSSGVNVQENGAGTTAGVFRAEVSLHPSRTTEPTVPQQNHLDLFFSQYPEFDAIRDRSESVAAQMGRLRRREKWWGERTHLWDIALAEYHEALVLQFNASYGTDVNDLETWHRVLKIIGAELPKKVWQCRQLMASLHVNLVDLVDASLCPPGSQKEIQIFGSVEALSKYTIETRKYFPKKHAKAGGMLSANSAEENDIHAYIQRTLKAIAQLDWEIGRTNAILEMLVLEREKLVEMVEEHKALLSPWRRMPDDVLGEIFLRCEKGVGGSGDCGGGGGSGGRESDAEADSIPDSFDPVSGPLLISQICRRWRTKALNTPELWSTIRIRVGRGDLQESRRLPLLDAWLKRSANHPLSICMVERSPRSPIYNSDSKNLAVGMLLSVARKWKRLDLVLNSATTHWGLFSALKGKHLPMLERCTIVTPKEETTTSTNGDQHPHEALVNLLTGASGLKSLRLDYNVLVSSIKFPRTTVTKLDLYTITQERSIPAMMAWDTLSRCPNLRSFRVRCHGISFAPPRHLHHNSLSSLDLSIVTDTRLGSGQAGVETLLMHVTAPNLTQLRLSSTPGQAGQEVEWEPDEIMSFLARCGEIRELGLEWRDLQWKWLVEVLECERVKRSLEVLSLDLGLGVTDEVLLGLAFPSPPPASSGAPHSPSPAPMHINDCQERILVPRLKTLRIGGRLFISPNDFLSLISSRRYPNIIGVEVLEEVIIDCEALVYGFMSPYLVEQLDELGWWGLRVSIWESGKLVYTLEGR
ncbi:hypothetical protein AN958_10599 [Leucoagaricus sp. SymC.cos]|nr:hypothetical protein AN958_10599 [Leucoagaricus sp. SymC.cos]